MRKQQLAIEIYRKRLESIIICGQESKLDESMKTSEMIPPPFQDQVFRKDFKAGERGAFVAIKSNIRSTI